VWKANLSVIGADGLPATKEAGNVIRPSTSLKLSLRIAPSMNAEKAKTILIEKLTTNVPYDAKVTIDGAMCGNGWQMKDLEDWLSDAVNDAGAKFFDGKATGSYG